MNFKIEYKYRGILDSVYLSGCENIMDALYKFYESHGFGAKINKIELSANPLE